MSFDAATDAAARAQVTEFRRNRTPIVNARLVRIEELEVKVEDTPGYEFLPWNDCECGCYCSNITLGSRTYSVFHRDIDTFRLDYGHSAFAGALGIFDSFADADREVRRLAKLHVGKEFGALKETAQALGVPTA
ncbi:hypothetical protein HY091_01025 [Candidatus Kaiserbacteria bacterium]|nr:hypothetical protein [Candidatus Kaiserbacteria bacterium]